ncbi:MULTISPECIES: MFS transporter permease [unclassified Microbacterium]|uniref:MFS transporter permease n=1 Tax=unclassified Microbacterium TaxID=2609290 RepID=UPI00214BFA09|nr:MULTISPECIES: MFS transporter permease [unclassified Microbacterium]MCR2785419.1 MFS transporter permease [Microbacterium sp. zg.B96]WIM14553.1 MFS transporter permease [Microbacterium sp. zg-B96]
MWLRRAFYLWLLPAAFVLPMWLVVGWVIFDGGGWALLWVLFLAVPAVFIAELVLMLLVRARGTVRAQGAVSWWDVLGFGLWHLSIIALGFFGPAWIPQALGAAGLAVGVFWLSLWQLWTEARPRLTVVRAGNGTAFIPAAEPRREPDEVADVVIIEEKRLPPTV